jgi:large conductance mechanosensitive channel
MRNLLDEFKKFAMRGNVVDLAVAVIIGIAFGAVVSAFTDGVLMAFIAAIFGEPNFDSLTFDVGDGVILYGAFLTAVVNFLLIAFALFLIIRAIERVMPRRVEESGPSEVDLLIEIRDELRARR